MLFFFPFPRSQSSSVCRVLKSFPLITEWEHTSYIWHLHWVNVSVSLEFVSKNNNSQKRLHKKIILCSAGSSILLQHRLLITHTSGMWGHDTNSFTSIQTQRRALFPLKPRRLTTRCKWKTAQHCCHASFALNSISRPGRLYPTGSLIDDSPPTPSSAMDAPIDTDNWPVCTAGFQFVWLIQSISNTQRDRSAWKWTWNRHVIYDMMKKCV